MTASIEIEITAENLADHIDKIKDKIGHDLIENIIKQCDISQQKGLLNSFRARAKSHPLATAWIDLENDIKITRNSGKLHLGFQSIILLERLLAIILAKESGFWNQIYTKIINPTQFYSTLFEVEVWKWYQSIFPKALILSENCKSSPDLEIILEGGSVYVECKSLQDAPTSEKNSWNELSASIVKILQRNQCWWRVHIAFKGRMKSKDISEIEKIIQEKSERNDISPIVFDNRVHVEIEVITDSNLFMPGPLSITKRGALGWIEAVGLIDKAGNTFYKCPRIVEISPYYNLYPEKQILEIIRTASKQIPDNFPGIVHVEIPYRDGDEILTLMENLYDRIHIQINNNFRRINAVVLSAKRTNNSPRNPEDIINHHQIIIPNHRAYVKLPDDFRIFGSSTANSEFEQNFYSLGSEGTIIVEYNTIPSIEEQVGRNLLNFCSYDGQHQIKIWRDYQSNLLIEIVKPQMGRKKLLCKAPEISNFDKPKKIGISWNEFGIIAAFNGQILS